MPRSVVLKYQLPHDNDGCRHPQKPNQTDHCSVVMCYIRAAMLNEAKCSLAIEPGGGGPPTTADVRGWGGCVPDLVLPHLVPLFPLNSLC